MTDEKFHLSRRKALAALGSIGVASAGAGLGTTAYFSDQETFENNQLTAGTLDMKVSWEEHYSDWSEDESDGLEYEPIMEPPEENSLPGGEPSEWIPFPTPANPVLWVYDEDVPQFMENTTQEQFPADGAMGALCGPDSILADVPDDLGQPVIDLDDVKPGDFGEVTFDFALCDNPGYVWLTGGLRDASENGVTEPEDDDPDELGNDEGEEEVVELLDAIQVAYWYDYNCDNVVNFQGGDPETRDEPPVGGTVTSLRDLLNDLSNGNGIPVDGDPTSLSRDCFPARDDDGNVIRHCLSFAWWLPVDHANEIQSDSATFDLGFYTEQCRHNDGSGMAPELSTTTGSGDYSQVSYQKAFGMETLWGSSSYDDPTGQTPHEIKIHPAQSEAEAHHDFSPNDEQTVTVPFTATFDPTTATPSATFTVDGETVSDSDLTDDGVPTDGEVAVTVKAQDHAGDVARVENLQIGGSSVASVEAQKGGTELAWVAASGLDFSNPVSVTGDLTLTVEESNYDVNKYKATPGMGIDWK